jgi:hypothetical protein
MHKKHITYDLTCDRCEHPVDRLSQLYLKTPLVVREHGYENSRDETISELCDDCWDTLMAFLGKETNWWRKLFHFQKKEIPCP